MVEFNPDKFKYLTVNLSNCTYNGSSFLTSENLFALEKMIHNEFDQISELEFRGIGASMVRGNTNSLTLGVAAGYYNSEQSLADTSSEFLRAAIRHAITVIGNLTFSEIRIETTLTGKI